jgi:hypothetical protein
MPGIPRVGVAVVSRSGATMSSILPSASAVVYPDIVEVPRAPPAGARKPMSCS